MIKQSLVFDDLLERKYKILRASIMLGNLSNKEEVLSEYEETAKEVNKVRNNMYEEKLASKMYTTVSLEDESKRLEELIQCIQNRIDEQNAFLDDYIKVTSNYLNDVDVISGESSLDDYKLRLSNINEYLNNCEEIKKINSRFSTLNKELQEKNDIKANSEVINSKLEDELIDEFNKIISRDDYYANLNYSDLDIEIGKLVSDISEKETVMNTFISSYDALVNAGITGAEREEYSSYVRDAKKDYYDVLDKKYTLEVYKLVLDKMVDYEKLYYKRETINNLFTQREEFRKKLDIQTRDEFENFVKLCDEQFNIIKSQRFNLEEIDNLTNESNSLEDKLNNLYSANERQEIVDILNEFALNKQLDELNEGQTFDLDKEDNDNIFNEEIEDENNGYIFNGPVKPNMVIKIKDPVKINVKNASDTAKLVMKKVVIVLEPKKFNEKRNKLKEVEEQLENKEESIFASEEPINIELDTKAVDESSNVKEIDNFDEIKINTDEDNNITIPTEIFIDEAKQENLDLFTSTDPFLDDNDVIAKKKVEAVNSLPRVDNIGTVKPNTAFAKIEEAVKDNNDIILPTMGLSEQEKVDVPIVSENYIG